MYLTINLKYDKILSQKEGMFMMSFKNLKLLVLDSDDVLFNSSPLIQFHVEKNWPQFSTNILKTRERTISIVQHQYDEVEKEIKRARECGVVPNLPDFNITRNDVIRADETRNADFNEEYYRTPLIEIGESLEQVKYAKEMFLEMRDATVEADGKLSINEGKIPYEEIYRECNWLPYTKENVQELHNIFGSRLISLTAHNGIDDMNGREFEAKREAIKKMVSSIEHYGLRFHNTEHIDGIRRPRNSKGLKLKEIGGFDNLNGVVIVDDSMDNCVDIYMHGGTPIYVNPFNKPNPYGFAMVRSTKPESIERELIKCGYGDFDSEVLQKPKVLTKSK